jgi:TetR/AcrR family transcriptional regulator, transcriptional repressor for nem operon
MENDNKSKSEKTKRFIIEKTAPLFNKKGFAGTYLSDMEQATGLTKGSIYGNFKNKDEVAVYAFRYNVKFISSSFEEEIKKSATYIDRILAYSRVYRSIYRQVLLNGGCPIANTIVEADDTNVELNTWAVSVLDKWKNSLMKFITQGKIAGEIKENCDSLKTATTIISLIEGSSIVTKATCDESYILNALDHIDSLVEAIKIKTAGEHR